MLLQKIDIFEETPDVESRLLRDRDPNEAYLTRDGNETYGLYLPDGGAVTLDRTEAKGT